MMRRIVIVSALFAGLLALTWSAPAETGSQYDLSLFSADGGSGLSQSGDETSGLNGSNGQPDTVGTPDAGGFWAMTTPTPTPTPTHPPGLVIQGHVRLNDAGGPGLGSVEIYRSFAAYPGDLVASTDGAGQYWTGFMFIPGDETITMWAEREGYTFDPERYSWRHYFGYESRTLDFVAHPYTPTPTPTSTPADRPVTGGVIIDGATCCVDGQAHIDARFIATSPVGDVAEMRAVAEQYDTTLPVCRKESEMAGAPWEPFVPAKTFAIWPVGHYVPLRVSAQYRDVAGNLSPIYCDSILLLIPTPTVSPTPTVTPTPTSVRVIDLGVTVDDSADPVTPGEAFQYTVAGRKIQPLNMVAPNVTMSGELSPAGKIRFTGNYTVFGHPFLQCQVEETSFQCYSQYDPGTVQLEAIVDTSSGGQASLCASIGFSPPSGGGDPNLDNNRDCEDTEIVVAEPEFCRITGQVSLQGRTDDSGATILVNGTPITTTTSDGQFTSGRLGPGDYQVTARHPSYLDSAADAVRCVAYGLLPLPATTLLGGDVNGDGHVDVFDLVRIAALYNVCLSEPSPTPPEDVNGDYCVDFFDLVITAANFGEEGPTPWGTPPASMATAADFQPAAGQSPTFIPPRGEPVELPTDQWWDLEIVDAHNLYGIDVALTFDATAIEVIDADPDRAGVQVMPGPIFAGPQSFVVANQVTVDEETGIGTITFAATLLHPAEPMEGEEILLGIPFESVEPPIGIGSTFNIENVMLADRQSRPLRAEWAGSVIWQLAGFETYLPVIKR